MEGYWWAMLNYVVWNGMSPERAEIAKLRSEQLGWAEWVLGLVSELTDCGAEGGRGV